MQNIFDLIFYSVFYSHHSSFEFYSVTCHSSQLFLYAACNETFSKMKSYSICLCLLLVVSVTFIQFIKICLFPTEGGSTGYEGLAEFSILNNITIVALWHIFVTVSLQGIYQQIFTCLGYEHAFYIIIKKNACHCNKINLNVVILFLLKGVYFEK